MLINVVLGAEDSSGRTGYEAPEALLENNQCPGQSEI
jgi:hypothetical protein